ncbi:MAG: hypothetical protein AAF702_07785 [Chloroflexota bacterium]
MTQRTNLFPVSNASEQPNEPTAESAGWKPDWLLRMVLFGTTATFVLTWLPLIRGLLDGDSYRWGKSYFGIQFGGAGLSGDYWLLVVEAIWLWTLLFMGSRGARTPFHWLLSAWHLLLAFNAFYRTFYSPNGIRFRGDTLNLDLDVTYLFLPVYSIWAILALVWVTGNVRRDGLRAIHPWNRTNTILLGLLLALLPVQFLLLRFDTSGYYTDVIGVFLTIPQALLLPLAFWPWRGEVSENQGTL